MPENMDMISLARRFMRPVRMPHTNHYQIGDDRWDENQTQAFLRHGRQFTQNVWTVMESITPKMPVAIQFLILQSEKQGESLEMTAVTSGLDES